MTTHYLEEAEQAETICVIKGGRVVAKGSPAALKAQLLRPALTVDAEDRGRLRAELARLGATWTETPRFRIELDGQDGRGAHELLKGIETPLTVVRTEAPTLEDAYLAIVANGSEATEVTA